jgi:hypothetical protein
MRESVGRLLLVEALDNADFGAQTLQRFLFLTGCVSASNAWMRSVKREMEKGQAFVYILFPYRALESVGLSVRY